jgi:hypothetical protein
MLARTGIVLTMMAVGLKTMIEVKKGVKLYFGKRAIVFGALLQTSIEGLKCMI